MLALKIFNPSVASVAGGKYTFNCVRGPLSTPLGSTNSPTSVAKRRLHHTYAISPSGCNIKSCLQIRARARPYCQCCPPRPPPGQCGCPPFVPGGGRRIVPPADCRPGPISPNPCCPRYPPGKGSYKKYKYGVFFVGLPLIIIAMCNAFGSEEHPHKLPCRDYEYMRRRTKRFPWGDGTKSFFHDDCVNHLPGECEPPPPVCEDDD